MKKLILRSSLYLLPYVMIYLFALVFYKLDEGDLVRLGYVPQSNLSYQNEFSAFNDLPIRFDELQYLPKKKHYRVLTIGDSFTGQGNVGYKNQLAQEERVLNVANLSWNPIETLSLLVNGDFFEHYQIDYIVLESVERSMPLRIGTFDTRKALSFTEIEAKMKAVTAEDEEWETMQKMERKAHEHPFFSNQSLVFLKNAFKFYFQKDVELENEVLKTTLKEPLFEVNNQSLLFIKEDVEAIAFNNNPKNAEELNKCLQELNQKLREKGIELIYMTAPDKYGVYYDYIAAPKYPKPLFFTNFKSLDKDYYYIDTQELLKNEIQKGVKDIYYFDDTHWSPKATQLVKEEILKIIR